MTGMLPTSTPLRNILTLYFKCFFLYVIVSVQMVNDTEAGLLQDYQRIRSLEGSGLFELL